jgi:carnosine N-methyltransferase
MIPDVNPSEILGGENADADFSMAAGDFASIYSDSSQHEAWDAVVCCFFLDASPSIIQYIQIIHDMLKDGGILINFGPLLYHWSGPLMRPDDETKQAYQSRFSHLDNRYMSSIDYCWHDVREILINAGFVIEEEHVGIQSHYTADVTSMMIMSYRCVHFVARKKTAEPKTKDNESAESVSNEETRSDEESETKDVEASEKVDTAREMSV